MDKILDHIEDCFIIGFNIIAYIIIVCLIVLSSPVTLPVLIIGGIGKIIFRLKAYKKRPWEYDEGW